MSAATSKSPREGGYGASVGGGDYAAADGGAESLATRFRGAWAAAVVVAFGVMVAANALSSATKVFGDTNNAEISNANPTFLTPDGATFSIWGLIYAGEAAFLIWQATARGGYGDVRVDAARPWVVLAFALNAVWLPVFQYRRYWLALGVIVAYLWALWRVTVALRVDYAAGAVPVRHAQSWAYKLVGCVGFSLNMGWVVVASLLNLTVVSRTSGIIVTVVSAGAAGNATAGWVPGTASALVGGNVDWTVFCIAGAVALALVAAWTRADGAYVGITMWALAGVRRMQTTPAADRFPVAALSGAVAEWALAGIVVLAVAGVAAVVGGVVWRRRSAEAAAADGGAEAAAV